MAEERNVNMDTASQVDDGIERGEEPMEQEDTAQPAAPPPAVEKLPPFTKLKARGRKLLRWIPPVKFFGMGEDGYYSIHIEHDCMIKTTRFIEKNIPGYKFYFVPFGPDESIHVLVAPGCPLHSTDKDTTCSDLSCETKPHGTVGCIATLVDPNDNTPSKDDIYVLTAHHVLDKCTIPGGEYVSWTKEDQSDKHTIGNEVPFKIPLRCTRQRSDDSGICCNDEILEYPEWHDNSQKDQDKEDDRVRVEELEKFIKQKATEFEETDRAKDEEEQQYDIACIRVDEESADMKAQIEGCSCCTNNVCEPKSLVCSEGQNVKSADSNTDHVTGLKELIGSVVQKVEHATEPRNGKIVMCDAAGLINVCGKTSWVNNLIVNQADTDVKSKEVINEYMNEGDSGSIVCKVHEGKKDWSNSYMVFAGWTKTINEVPTCCMSLAFSLPDAMEQLVNEMKQSNENFSKKFKFSCRHITPCQSASASISCVKVAKLSHRTNGKK